MILAASLEFDKKRNSEIVERQSDNEEIPQVRHTFNSSFCLYMYIFLFVVNQKTAKFK